MGLDGTGGRWLGLHGMPPLMAPLIGPLIGRATRTFHIRKHHLLGGAGLAQPLAFARRRRHRRHRRTHRIRRISRRRRRRDLLSGRRRVEIAPRRVEMRSRGPWGGDPPVQLLNMAGAGQLGARGHRRRGAISRAISRRVVASSPRDRSHSVIRLGSHPVIRLGSHPVIRLGSRPIRPPAVHGRTRAHAAPPGRCPPCPPCSGQRVHIRQRPAASCRASSPPRLLWRLRIRQLRRRVA